MSAEDSSAPTEFRVFPAGRFETVKGAFLVDKEASKKVLAHRSKRDVDMRLDYEHATVKVAASADPANASKARESAKRAPARCALRQCLCLGGFSARNRAIANLDSTVGPASPNRALPPPHSTRFLLPFVAFAADNIVAKL